MSSHALDHRCPTERVPLLRDPIRDLRLRTGWRPGPAADHDGMLLISYTEFTPDRLRDMAGVYLAAERLSDAIAELEGAVGVTTYWQLLRGRGGSLSAWVDEEALRRFVGLPYHREIMRRYRTRGGLRACQWHADAMDIPRAFRRGQASLA